MGIHYIDLFRLKYNILEGGLILCMATVIHMDMLVEMEFGF